MKSILVTLSILLIASIAWAEAGTAVKASPLVGDFHNTNVLNKPNVGAAGGLLWRFTTSGSHTYDCPTYSNQVVYSGTYGGTSFYAIYAANGTQKWTAASVGQSWSKPAVDEASGLVFFESYSTNRFYALNTSNGTTRWSYSTSVYYPVSSPAVLGDYVYFADLNGALYKINKTTGALGWRTVISSSGIGITRPVFNGDSLVMINTYNTSTLGVSCRRISTGAAKWGFSTGNASEGKPVVNGNVLYVGGNAGEFALNALTGTQIWKFTFGSYHWGGTAYYNNMVYAGSHDAYAYGLNAATGTQVWKSSCGQCIFLPDVADNIAVFGGGSSVYGFNATTGATLWTYAAGATVTGGADIYDGMVFFNSGSYVNALQVGNFVVNAGAIDGTWYSNETKAITWTAEGKVDTINLYYSTNGGTAWTSIGKMADTGTYNWKVPWANSTTCLIKLTNWHGNISDNSDTFTISPGTITVTSPNGGEKWTVGDVHNITWTASTNLDSVLIEYSTNTGSSWIAVARKAASAGTHSWTVPNTPSKNCLVRVSNTAYTDPKDQSNAVFEIAEPVGFKGGMTAKALPNVFTVSPNPFTDRLTVNMTAKGAIYSLTGNLIARLDKGRHTVYTSNWAPGIYMIKCGEKVKRVVKN